MIVKVLSYNISETGGGMPKILMYYIKSKTHATEDGYKKLYWGEGYPLFPENVKLMDYLYEDVGMVHMVIFSPVRYMIPPMLFGYTRDTMLEYRRKLGYTGLRFVYGFHYNTNHPHSHVVITSGFRHEAMMQRWKIYLLRRIASEVFREPIGENAYFLYSKELVKVDPNEEPEKVRSYARNSIERIDNEFKSEEEEILDLIKAGKDIEIEDIVDEEEMEM